MIEDVENELSRDERIRLICLGLAVKASPAWLDIPSDPIVTCAKSFETFVKGETING